MATRFAASPSRLILDLLKQNKQMTRQQILEATPRSLITSKRRINKVIRTLWTDGRIVPFLEVGKIQGKDNWVYKLNPMKEKINFPATCKKKSVREQELAYVMSLPDDADILPFEPKKHPKQKEEEPEEQEKSFVAEERFDPSKE